MKPNYWKYKELYMHQENKTLSPTGLVCILVISSTAKLMEENIGTERTGMDGEETLPVFESQAD